MMTNNMSLSEESEVNELEITKFNVEVDYDHDHDEYDDDDDDENEELNILNLKNKNKQKNYKIKLVFFLICLVILLLLLLLDLFAGGILQKSFGFLGSNNNDEYNGINIMDEIHIRSKLMRELRGNRTNEQECEARRCCDIRDGLSINQLPKGLDCSLLTDDECGDMDEFCEWDCHSSIYKSRKKGKFIRHFRKISGFPIQYQQPHQLFNNNYNESGPTNNAYQQCLEATKFISSDDCGIEYEEELDPKLAQALCQSHDEYPEYFVSDSSGNGSSGNDTMDSGEYIDDGPRRLTVFNPDLRAKVTSYAFPYTTIMLITYTDTEGYQRICTGTMISNRWLLTAAHCLWGNGNYHSNHVVYRNVREVSDITHQNRLEVERIMVFADYQTDRPSDALPAAPDYDMGLMRLRVDLGETYLGFGYCDSWVGAFVFNDFQFPTDHYYNLLRQACSWNLIHALQFETNQCSAYLGSSGGPIYRYDPSGTSRIIYAVHSSEARSKNVASRMTYGKLVSICIEIEVDQPGRCGGLV